MSVAEIQWRNIRKVVKALADRCFCSPNHAQYGVFHTCLTAELTAKDGLDVTALQLEPLLPDDMGYKSITNDGPVGTALIWLEAAIKCEAFEWDGDQREYAMKSLEDARAWLAKLGPVPEAPENETREMIELLYNQALDKPKD